MSELGTCHGCGGIKVLYPCPYSEEIMDDDTIQCCDDCAPEHAQDI